MAVMAEATATNSQTEEETGAEDEMIQDHDDVTSNSGTEVGDVTYANANVNAPTTVANKLEGITCTSYYCGPA